MERKYINELIAWKDNPRRKPLIVWGARQVGKTYLIRNLFAEQEYKGKYIYIDCRTETEFVSFCERHTNAKEVLDYISLDHDMVLGADTLIIFDEVQECLPIVTLMKYFCQDYREIPVIVTGSMVRIRIQRENRKRGASENGKFLFPVGKINQLTVYPMNFEEYICNRNKLLYIRIVEAFQKKEPLDDLTHQKALDCFWEYLLIGGMPEAVDTFLETESLQQAREVLKDLYDNYLADMELYQASPEAIVRSKKIFDNIFSQLNKENKNFMPSLVEKGAKNRDLYNPIDWLTFAFLVCRTQLVKEIVTSPLSSSEESLYRLYLSDMGIFSYQSRVNPTVFISKDKRNTLQGVFFENYVAIELVNAGMELFYWKGKNDSEFEFIIEDADGFIPIDVKKGKGTLNSLEKYRNHNRLNYAVKVSVNKYGFDPEHRILTIPFYQLFLFTKQIAEQKKASY